MAVEVQFNVNPQAYNDAWWRAQDPRVRALRDLSYEERVSRAISLLQSDPSIKIDWPIAVSEIEGTPYLCTLQRMELGMTREPCAQLPKSGPPVIFSVGGSMPGTKDVNSMTDADSFPVPPSLTPWPDPPAKVVNRYVGSIWDADRNLYTATDLGMTCPPGWVEQEGDGHFYKCIGQLRTGDPITQFLRLD